MIRPNMFEMADGCREQASAQQNYNWVNCLVEIWANEQIQRQLLAVGEKQNI